MTILIPATDLKTATAWAAKTLPAHPAVAVLGGIVLNATDGLLSLAAFDYETYATIGLPVRGDLPTEVLVHGRLLADAAARLTGDVRIDLHDSELVLTAGRSALRVRTMPAEEYPQVPPQADPVGTVDADDLINLVAAASVCAARDIKQAALMRVRLVADGNTLTAWATDRYRAAQVTTAWSGGGFDVLLSAAALTGAIKGMTGTLQVGADIHRVTITGADRAVTLMLAHGDWPAIDRLWSPRGGATHVDRADLVDAIATARLSVEGEHGIHLDVTDGPLTLAAASDRSTSRVDVDGDGDLSVHLTVNPGYLADILSVLPGPRVHIAVDAKRPTGGPLEIQSADQDGQPLDGATYLLVPIREDRR